MAGKKARLLVVEDEAIVARDLAQTLRRLGYEVVGQAATGEDALTLARRKRPDLVLMDVRLPGGTSGLEAGRRIYSELEIPIVYLTAYADEQTLSSAKLTAPFGYLIKPFVERELAVALDMALYRARMERQLEERTRWLEATLTGIGDAVIAADVNNRVAFMNPVAEHLTGWRREEAIGRPLQTVFRTVEVEAHSDGKATEESAHPDNGDRTLISADGTHRPINCTVSPINDRTGMLMGVVIAFRDLSAYRRHESHMMARQKMEAIGKLASNIAHEFNNLLTLMAGHASSMLEYLAPNTRPAADARRILEAVRHASTLTKRILSVARASDIEKDINIQRVPLGTAIQSALGLLEEQLRQKNIVVRVRNLKALPTVLADPAQLVDVMVDMLLNAAEAMPRGGRVSIDAREQASLKPDQRLNPNARRGRYAILRIRDTGPGIPPEALDRIFEPFFTTKGAGGHLGLGLSVVHTAVQRCGGWIRVSSRPGHGATFTIYLPSTEAVGGASAHPAQGGDTVVVADDDAAALKQARAALEGAGFRVHTATSGEDCLRVFRRHADATSLVVQDLVMPDLHGRALFEALQNIKPDTPVLLTSGFSRDYARKQVPVGSWRFLQKPFSDEQLLVAVRRALEPSSS